jgi:hypothetical protein
MPALVGGFGNFNCSNVKYHLFFKYFQSENFPLLGLLGLQEKKIFHIKKSN